MTADQSVPWEIDVPATDALLRQDADMLLLDCREPDEFAFAKIEGATLVPMSQLRERIAELDAHRQRHIVVYCHHGGRSLRVTQFLRQQGFVNVQSMAGGIDQWSEQIDATIPRY